MAFQASSPSWLAATLALLSFFSLLLPANALYFYVEGRQPKCFFEDLPKDTLVAGMHDSPDPKSSEESNWLISYSAAGKFETQVINPNSNGYTIDPNLKMLITVDETFDNDHRVVSKREGHSGRFTFSAADAGQHRLCFTADTDATSGGWLSNSQGAVRVTLDIAIGETSKIETEDKDKMKDIVQRIRDLNSRLHDIRREQVYQRVSLISSLVIRFHHDLCSVLLHRSFDCVLICCSVGTRGRVP